MKDTKESGATNRRMGLGDSKNCWNTISAMQLLVLQIRITYVIEVMETMEDICRADDGGCRQETTVGKKPEIMIISIR